jgi:general stress protein 26
MNEQQQKEYCQDVIRTSPACYLATLNDAGLPEIRAMLNLRNDRQFPALRPFFSEHGGDFTVFLGTNTSSVKYRQVVDNPNVAVYYCAPEHWQGVMLAGKLEIVTDASLKQSLWLPDWTMYYPLGPGDPDYTVFRLQPDRVKAYGNLSTFAFAPEAV